MAVLTSSKKKKERLELEQKDGAITSTFHFAVESNASCFERIFTKVLYASSRLIRDKTKY